MLDRLRWAVREALAWDGVPKTAEEVARMFDVSTTSVLRALRRLRREGEVRRVGRRWVSTEPLRIGGM